MSMLRYTNLLLYYIEVEYALVLLGNCLALRVAGPATALEILSLHQACVKLEESPAEASL